MDERKCFGCWSRSFSESHKKPYRECKVDFTGYSEDLKEFSEDIKFSDLEIIFKDLRSLFEKRGFIINWKALEKQSLDETINYETFVNEVVAICKNNSFNLLETLAYTILNSFKRHEKISSMTVTIHKPNSPLQDNVDDVSVTVSEKF